MPRPIALKISVAAMAHNLAIMRQRLDEVSQTLNRDSPKIWAVIKANAYGHGIEAAVSGFAQADGLAMLDLHEAMLCRQLGWTKPILLLEGFFGSADLQVIDEQQLAVVVHSFEQLAQLAHFQPRQPVPIYLKINTGMNRLGFALEELEQAWSLIQALMEQELVHFLGSMTHFACADEPSPTTVEQIQLFRQYNPAPDYPFSVCNSAAALRTELQSYLGTQPQWVRLGICLYGATPFVDLTAEDFDLRPAQTLEAEILSIQQVKPGQGVGYGHLFTAEQPMRIGVVSCGYADGYPRQAPNGTPIIVAGQRTQVVGCISMDLLTVDLTNIPQAQVGSPVILWGHAQLSVNEVAEYSGTIGYELLSTVTQRVPRYQDNT